MKTEIGKRLESNAPNSMQEIDDVMTEMDKTFRTNFKDWIRDESNLSFICTMKRPIFMKEFRQDPQRGIRAIGWITKNWSLTSIMEFLLKMFPQFNIDSHEFARLVYDLTSDWPLYKTNELIKLLLVGESASTCARFIYCFNGVTRSDLTELLATLSKSLNWDSTFLRLFLLDFSMMINANGVEHRALIVLIHQSMDDANTRKRPNQALAFDSQDKKSGIEAPPNSPCGTPPNSIWEYGIKCEEDQLIQRLVSIQEFKIFLALFEVVMDIHEKHNDVDFEESLTGQLMNELEL